MGFGDKAKAIANEVVESGRRNAEAASSKLTDVSERADRVGRSVSFAQRAVENGRARYEKTLGEIDSTRAGKRAGQLVRGAGSLVAKLPVLSATADGIRARHCVDLLVERLKDEPENPYAHLWLAESLIRSSDDLKTYRIAAGILDPTSLVVSGLARQTATLGRDSDPVEVRLLKHAWGLAGRDLRDTRRNPNALDVLARVCLATDDAARAIEIARAAVLSDPSLAAPRLTLSRALLRVGRLDEAFKWASSAVDRGSTLGYLFMAEVEQGRARRDKSQDFRTRVNNFEDLAKQVKSADRISYYGAAREPRQVLVATKNIQTQKSSAAIRKIKRLGRIVKDA